MKTFVRYLAVFSVVFAFQATSVHCQDKGKLYVTMAHRFNQFGGTLISINADGTGYSKLISFDPPGGFQPQGGVILGRDGKLYGTTAGGGSNNSGTIYSINPDGTGYSVLHEFGDQMSGGVSPQSTLVQGIDGKLYGNTLAGGRPQNQGTVFSAEPDGNHFSKLLDFDGDNGVSPGYVPMVQDSLGILYGITAGGGADQYDGVIFSMHTDGSGYMKLHDFNDSDGSNPFTILIGKDGKLYGVTSGGGAYRGGTVFSINRDGSRFSSLFSFNNDLSISPRDLIQVKDGNLIGTTEGGYGSLFTIHTDGSEFRVLHSFDRSTNMPYSLQQAPDGTIYGVTRMGGSDLNVDGGTVYSINVDGSGFQRLMDCTDSTGMYPVGILWQGDRDQSKLDQSITFDSLSSMKLKSQRFVLTATASSGLPVSFSCSDSTIASISGDTVIMHKAGRVIITASQAGDTHYNPATPVQRVLEIIDRHDDNLKVLECEIFPNPSNLHFTVKSQSDVQQPMDLTVLDMTGMVVDRIKGFTNEPIPLGEKYKAGIYFVRLSSGDEQVIMRIAKLE